MTKPKTTKPKDKVKSKSKQKPKVKLQIKVVIDKWLARALSLTKGVMRTYSIDCIYFNAKEKELVATNGHTLLVVKFKPAGSLLVLNLEEGLYDIIGETLLLKEDINQETTFPKYQKIIPTGAKEICHGHTLSGVIDCMIKNQVYLDVWRFASVLRILNNLSLWWTFTNNSPVEPVMMEAENSKYHIKYVIMAVLK